MTRNEAMLWWKVALHIDEAQIALANAMKMNSDDPRLAYALQEKLREAQAFLLGIFGEKGLLPSIAAPPPPPRPPMARQPSRPPSPPPAATPPAAVVAPMSPDQLRASLEQPSGSWIPDDPEAAPEDAPVEPAVAEPTVVEPSVVENSAVEVLEPSEVKVVDASAKETPPSSTANGASTAPIEVAATVVPSAETEA